MSVTSSLERWESTELATEGGLWLTVEDILGVGDRLYLTVCFLTAGGGKEEKGREREPQPARQFRHILRLASPRPQCGKSESEDWSRRNVT